MITGNLLTIEDNPVFRPDQMPVVPKADYLIAKGGEKTYELDKSCKFADGKAVIVHEREAREGEIIRDVDLKFKLDVSENIAYRMRVRTAADNSQSSRDLQMALCQSSIEYFCNVWCWTFVPGEEAVPFILYDFQVDLITWFVWLIKNRFSGLCEKSRCQGLSWLTRVVHAWIILFFKNKVDYSLSLGKTEVDDRTMDSLFGKQRYLFKHLPEWMRAGWGEKIDDIDNIMRIKTPGTNSLIKGLLTGSTAGRSGRGTFADYDEFAHVESARETLEASSSLASCEVYISTVKGRDNPFAQMAHAPGTLKKTTHWKENPVLNDEWATKERAKPKYFTQELWDQEMEIQYETSTSGRVFPQLISRVSPADANTTWCHVQTGEYYEFDENYTVHIGMDYGLADPNTVVYAQLKAPPPGFQNKFKTCLVFFDEDCHRDQPFDKLVPMIQEKPYRYETYVGDLYTADKRENIRGEKYKDFFRSKGMHVVGKRNSIIAPIEELKGRLEVPGAIAINGDKCPELVIALQNWAYPTDAQGLAIPGSKPQARSQYSHYCKAICYLVDYMFGQAVSKKGKAFRWGVNLVNKVRL